MNEKNEAIEIDLIGMIGYLLKRWYYFVFSVLATTVIGLAICTFAITPQFKSTTTVYIQNNQNANNLSYQDFQVSNQLTKDYEELIKSRSVLESVISTCALKDTYEELLGRISVVNEADTRMIAITVQDPVPESAQLIANSIRLASEAHILTVTGVDAVKTNDEANYPTKPASPSRMIWAVLSAGIGGMAMLVFLVIRFLSDDSIKSEQDVEAYLGLPTLALIPKMDTSVNGKNSKKKKSSSNRSGSSGRSASNSSSSQRSNMKRR